MPLKPAEDWESWRAADFASRKSGAARIVEGGMEKDESMLRTDIDPVPTAIKQLSEIRDIVRPFTPGLSDINTSRNHDKLLLQPQDHFTCSIH